MFCSIMNRQEKTASLGRYTLQATDGCHIATWHDRVPPGYDRGFCPPSNPTINTIYNRCYYFHFYHCYYYYYYYHCSFLTVLLLHQEAQAPLVGWKTSVDRSGARESMDFRVRKLYKPKTLDCSFHFLFHYP